MLSYIYQQLIILQRHSSIIQE